jgi:hypothetical protein
MPFPAIYESITELTALEVAYPVMARRLHVLQMFKRNPNETSGNVADGLGVFEYEVERWGRLYQVGGISLLLNPQTLLDPQDSQNLTFSQYAEIRTLDLFKEHNNQIGRELWKLFERCKKGDPKASSCEYFAPYADWEAKYKNWYRTDCQTYIFDVLKYAFEKIGYRKLYTGLLAAFKKEGTTGTVMAKYLTQIEWKAYFFMPDTVNPKDGNAEHTRMYEKVLKTRTWWGVPITDIIVNYDPTSGTKDAEGDRKFNVLSTALFGVCIFTKGLHTALLSKGKIYEVHWTGISSNQFNSPVGSGDSLYGRTDLKGFDWIEGVVVIPPDISL